MSDVFGRHPGDERLDAEVSAALAARVHRRSRIAVWMGRVALAAALVLVVVTGFVVAHEETAAHRAGSPTVGPTGPLLAVVAITVLIAAIVLVVATKRRTRRLLEASAPEGGVVLGLSSAGVNLTHLPLLEWDAVRAVGVAERRRGAAREVTVGLAVPDVDAARARIIDARLVHLVRPFPRRSPSASRVRSGRNASAPEPGFLAVDLGDLLDARTIDAVLVRIEEEAEQRGLPFHRVDDRRRLGGVLRPSSVDRQDPSS